jgi:hypothetical protein
VSFLSSLMRLSRLLRLHTIWHIEHLIMVIFGIKLKVESRYIETKLI